MQDEYSVTIAGDKIMMHNEQLANPFNEWKQALEKLTRKKGKVLTDHAEIANIEFQGGLYFDDQLGPYVPGHCVVKMLVEGARRRKLGKLFEQSVNVNRSKIPLLYEGPRTREGLWADARFRDQRLVGVNAARTMRTRPTFEPWALDFVVTVADGAVNSDDLRSALESAMAIGLLDGRPVYAGQFGIEAFAKVVAGKLPAKAPAKNGKAEVRP